ncbi:MAG: hypothetical protein C0478_17355 [Planctomyces sp.]|nr:hypothetical protein [Planctomyces sp.]
MFNAPKELYPQLRALDPRDFEQAKRAEFMLVRGRFEHLVNPNRHEVISGTSVSEALKQLREVLDFYSGEGTHLDSRTFAFLREPELVEIVKRDYRELSLRLHPSHSWKSSVVLAGSILEAILYDVLSGPRNQANANSYVAGHSQYRRQGAIVDGHWTLQALIDTAIQLQILRLQDKDIIHQTLRDYRNFIHPAKEIRTQNSVGKNEAGLAMNALNVVIDHLQKTFTP